MNIRKIPRRARRLTLATVLGAAVVGTVALAPTSARGQDTQPQSPPDGERMDPRQMIDLRMAKMTETLKLDSAQQDKIRWIVAGETVEMEGLRKNAGSQRGGGSGGGERSGGRGGGRRRGGGGGGAPPDSTGGGSAERGPSPEVRALRDRTDKQIEGLLNPQQLTTYRQLFEQHQLSRPAGDSASRRGGG